MNKVIVTTTIFEPSEAMEKFAAMKDWQLVVVGDKKTPHDAYKNRKDLIYVSPEDQESYDKELSDLIGFNSIQRRNFGFLWAKDLRADIVATVDDDNQAYEGWPGPILLNQPVECQEWFSEKDDLYAFDPLYPTNHSELHHRGFPIQLIKKRDYKDRKAIVKPKIQAMFWDESADVDALDRFYFEADKCKFNVKSFPFFSKMLAPFNSQNTLIDKDVLSSYFMFPHIFRLDDIVGSIYTRAKGFDCLYTAPTVKQVRPHHDFTVDMEKEYWGYSNMQKIFRQCLVDPEGIKNIIPERSWQAFLAYRKHFDDSQT